MRHGLALLGHLPLGAIVPGNRLAPGALGDGIERLLRRHGRPPARTLTPGSPAAATLTKELGIAYADKLPEEAPRGPLAVADRQGGTPRPAADKKTGDITEDRPGAAYWGEYGSEPVVGASDKDDFDERIVAMTGVDIPVEKKNERIKFEWVPFHDALKDAGLGPDARFAMLQTYAWEGGSLPDTQASPPAVTGITRSGVSKYGPRAGIPADTLPSQLTNEQRVAFYRAYFDWQDGGAFHRTGGLTTLDRIGNKQIAAALGDTLVRGGAGTVREVMQAGINSILEKFPAVAASISEQRRPADGPDRPGSTAARVIEDSKFGEGTLAALQAIASYPAATKSFLIEIAKLRLNYHNKHPDRFGNKPPEEGDKKRYAYFSFQ